jgi:hypothetical protein
MARPLRVEFEDAIHHVCNRGNARQRIFWDDRDRNRFIELPAELLTVAHHLRIWFAQFDLCLHFLQSRSKRFNLLLLLRDGGF